MQGILANCAMILNFNGVKRSSVARFLKDFSNLMSLGLLLSNGDSGVDAEVIGSLEGPK